MIENRKATYLEIVNNFALWSQFVDPDGHDDSDSFYVMNEQEKLDFMETCFGKETHQ